VPDWDYEHAYPGAPPPGGLITLARPLYPPDAVERGKKPSVDGPDCEAIRRGISRGGRAPWEWAIGDNKRKWSNTFAHGKPPGNVSESGAAGFQRQMGIDPSGWWGMQSHNALQYALIPEGLPHVGEHLLDDRARELLHEAVQIFKGDTSTVRAAALAEARTYLGYVESPPSTNCNMFGAWYGMNYQPWCAMFVTYCYELGSDGGSPSFVRGSKYSYCPYILNDARARRNDLSVTGDPGPGDLVLYDWEQNNEPDHIGLFEEWVSGRTFSAIEGNTSTSNNSNGGSVMRRQRDAGSSVIFVRVAEP
jgi:CHAP domain